MVCNYAVDEEDVAMIEKGLDDMLGKLLSKHRVEMVSGAASMHSLPQLNYRSQSVSKRGSHSPKSYRSRKNAERKQAPDSTAKKLFES